MEIETIEHIATPYSNPIATPDYDAIATPYPPDEYSHNILFLRRSHQESIDMEITYCGNIYEADTLFVSKDTAIENARLLLNNEWARETIIVQFDDEPDGVDYAVYRR